MMPKKQFITIAPKIYAELKRIAAWEEDTDWYSTAQLERLVAGAGKRARALLAEIKKRD